MCVNTKAVLLYIITMWLLCQLVRAYVVWLVTHKWLMWPLRGGQAQDGAAWSLVVWENWESWHHLRYHPEQWFSNGAPSSKHLQQSPLGSLLKAQTPWPYCSPADPNSQRTELENLPFKFSSLGNSDPEAHSPLRATAQIQSSPQFRAIYYIVAHDIHIFSKTLL